LGQRSRKRRSPGSAEGRRRADSRAEQTRDGNGRAPAATNMERGYARSRERSDAVRASLEPLAPGERPTAVTVAAVVAALIGVANVVLVVVGSDLAKQRVTGGLIFAAIMFIAAASMWRAKYWAVLGFQALLGLSVVTGSLSLLVASNVEAVIRSVVVIGAAGTLFWFLIRAMARLQMPTRTR
jgi:hypothetical protein